MITVDMHESTADRFNDSIPSSSARQLQQHHQQIYQLADNSATMNADEHASGADGSSEFYRSSSNANNRVSVISESGRSQSPSKQQQQQQLQRQQQQRLGTTQTDVAAEPQHHGPKILFNLLSQASHHHHHHHQHHQPPDGFENEDRSLLNDGTIAIRYHHTTPGVEQDDGEEAMKVEYHQTTRNASMLVDGGGRATVHSAPSAVGGPTTVSGRCYKGSEQQVRDAQQMSLLSPGNAMTTASGEFLIPQYCRPRSKSMGTNGWRPAEFVAPAGFGPGWWPSGSTLRAGNAAADASRTPSRDSLVSYDESIASSDDCIVVGSSGSHALPSTLPVRYLHGGGQAGNGRVAYAMSSGSFSRDDALVEDARSRLMTLMTTDRQPEVTVGPSGRRLRDGFSHSQPGTPLSSSPLPPSESHSSSSVAGGVYSVDARNERQNQRHFAHVYQQQQQQPFVRKYSEGSQMMRTHQGRWRNRAYSMVTSVGPPHSSHMTSSSSGGPTMTSSGEVSACVDSPVDLSCKRKKFEPGSASSAGLPYARRAAPGNGNFGVPVLPPLSRYAGAMPSNGFPPSSLVTSGDRLNASVDEGIGDNIADCDDTGSDSSSSTSGSLLRSILLQTGRGRSYSMSVCMTAARPTGPSAARGPEMDSAASVSGRLRWQLANQTAGSSPTSTPLLHPVAPPPQQPVRHQRVVLAKKNQLPVMARVADHLCKIVDLVRVLPRFELLPLCDRRMLLSNACGRLLLLYMAESNTQFAVTPMHNGAAGRASTATMSGCDDASLNLLTDEADLLSGCSQQLGPDRAYRSQSFGSRSAPTMSSRCVPGCGQVDAEVPTQQFVDGVQNFIRKCQSLALTVDEYVYMRIIALFHSGAGTLDRVDIAEQVNTEARQRLQDLVQRTHPSEKLRYSSILLTLHTLFGIHCGMLEALFYRPTSEAASFDEFVWNALMAAESSGTSVVFRGPDVEMVD